MLKKYTNKNIFQIFFQFITLFVTLSILPALYFSDQYSKILEHYLADIEANSFNEINFARHQINSVHEKINHSFELLSHSPTLLKTSIEPTDLNLTVLSEVWLSIANYQDYFSQFQLLDVDGNEQLRVHTDSNKTFVISKSELQNQSQYDFFSYAQTLPANIIGSFYLSHQNNGARQLGPAKWIYPLDQDSIRYGYFIADINLAKVYNLHRISINGALLPDLVTDKGEYLLSNELSNLLNNDNSEGGTLAERHPTLWEKITESDKGRFFDGINWYFFDKFNFANNDSYFIYTVTEQFIDQLFVIERNDLIEQILYTILLIGLLTLAFIIWTINHAKNSLDSRLARVAMNGMSAMVITDHNNRVVKINHEFTRISGYTFEEVSGKNPSHFASGLHPPEFYCEMWHEINHKGLWEDEIINKRKNGSYITEILRIQTVKDQKNDIQFYVASFVDISERKLLENQLRELSEKDSLADCWNRRKFETEFEKIQQTINIDPSLESCLAIIDIDYFKALNDQYGHSEGDRIIKETVRLLKEQCRDSDILARVGGEEFCILFPNTSLQSAEIITKRMQKAIKATLHEYQVTVSIGLTNIEGDTETSYKRADMALYQAKEGGRNKTVVLKK